MINWNKDLHVLGLACYLLILSSIFIVSVLEVVVLVLAVVLGLPHYLLILSSIFIVLFLAVVLVIPVYYLLF